MFSCIWKGLGLNNTAKFRTGSPLLHLKLHFAEVVCFFVPVGSMCHYNLKRLQKYLEQFSSTILFSLALSASIPVK